MFGECRLSWKGVVSVRCTLVSACVCVRHQIRTHTFTHTRIKSPKAQIMSGRNVLLPTGILNRQILRFANSPHWSLFMKDSHMKVLPVYEDRAHKRSSQTRTHDPKWVGGCVSPHVCLLVQNYSLTLCFFNTDANVCVFVCMGIWACVFTCLNVVRACRQQCFLGGRGGFMHLLILSNLLVLYFSVMYRVSFVYVYFEYVFLKVFSIFFLRH